MRCFVYVGTYMGEGKGEGIYLLDLDTERGILKTICSYPEVSDQPSFLAVERNHLYAVSERKDCGFVSAFSRNARTGELKLLNRVRTEGSDMCHVTVWPGGKYLSAANYTSGSLAVCEINGDGTVSGPVEFIQHEGKGTRPDRQEGPHVHSTAVSADGKYLYAADLGLDRIFCYRTAENGRLCFAGKEMQIEFPAGEGPRHFVFSADEKRLYAVTELGSRLFAFERSGMHGAPVYRKLYDVSALPEEFRGENLAADIHLSPDERFLYISNRGMDCITVFQLPLREGEARVLEYHTSHGREPRNFCLTPDGCHILIACQAGGKVVLCERDPHTGRIGKKIAEAEIPQAVFVKAVEKDYST